MVPWFFAMLLTSVSPDGGHATYLASIVNLPITSNERLEAFTLKTWGVQFKAVCKLPSGWVIKAGSSATPEGVLEGRGSLGATWLSGESPNELKALVLINVDAPVQHSDVRSRGGIVPATFAGHANVSTVVSD